MPNTGVKPKFIKKCKSFEAISFNLESEPIHLPEHHILKNNELRLEPEPSKEESEEELGDAPIYQDVPFHQVLQNQGYGGLKSAKKHNQDRKSFI